MFMLIGTILIIVIIWSIVGYIRYKEIRYTYNTPGPRFRFYLIGGVICWGIGIGKIITYVIKYIE